MQKVISVPNPDFTVPPITTIAQTIISRRLIKFPINTSGTYGHLKNTTYPYTITTDIGDNENIVDLSNSHLEFDFTGKWIDTTQNVQAPFLTPNFDQSSQALVNRLRIGTSQGMEIEQIQAYNKLSNLIQSYSMTSQTKDFHLTNESRFNKTVYSQTSGQSELNGDSLYGSTPTGGPPHQVAKRILLRLLHSSFFNRVKMLPLFLFRNGIRIELDFEDVTRAFVYESNHSAPMLDGTRLLPQFRMGVCTTVQTGASLPTWFISPGTITGDGTAQPLSTFTAFPNQVGAATNLYLTAKTNFAPLRMAQCFIGNPTAVGAVAGGYATTAGNNANSVSNPPGDGIPTAFYGSPIAPFIATTSLFAQFKNVLNLSTGQVREITSRAQTLFSAEQILGASQRLGLGVPVTIFENGQMRFRGFVALPADSLSLNTLSVSVVSAGLVTAVRIPLFNDPTNNGSTDLLQAAYELIGTGGVLTDGANGGNAAVSGFAYYVPLPLYSWDHIYSPSNSVPYKYFPLENQNSRSATLTQYYADMINLQASISIDMDNMFYFPTEGKQAVGNGIRLGNTGLNWSVPSHFAKDPRIVDLYALPNLGKSILQWDYTVTNIEWRLSLIKPSSDVFTQYTTAFQKDIGIPYPFTRVFQFTRTITGSTQGTQQIQIPISVRSLNSVLVVLGDPFFTTYDSNNPQRFFIPMLSTFQRRGLSRMELVTGGTVKPEYRVQMDPKMGISQIPLVENFFGLDGMTSFNPSFKRMFLGLTRNLMITGNFSNSGAVNYANYQNNANPLKTFSGVSPSSQSLTYADASKFVWGVNLAKKDTQGFASGLDTSMSGSLILNLIFSNDNAPTQPGETFDSGSALGRQTTVDVYCLADALFTAQNDANLIRW